MLLYARRITGCFSSLLQENIYPDADKAVPFGLHLLHAVELVA